MFVDIYIYIYVYYNMVGIPIHNIPVVVVYPLP